MEKSWCLRYTHREYRVDSANSTEIGRCVPREPSLTETMSQRSVFNTCLDSEMRDSNLDYYNSKNPLRVSPSGIDGNWISQDNSSFDGNSGNPSVPSRNTLCPQNVTRVGSSAVRLAS